MIESKHTTPSSDFDTSNVRIRTARAADLPTLLRFEQGVINAERPMDSTLKEGHIQYYNLNAMLESPDIELVVAELVAEPPVAPPLVVSSPAPALIGSGYARIDPSRHYLKHSVHAYLGFMYVEPAYRGKGVNQLIIAALKAWALSRQLTELRLDVYHTNTNAIKAYEKAGFTQYLLNMRMGI
jgi:GNAT superfamily N-acetyltransferase